MVRTIFICHISGCLCQLLMFTYSCDCIIRESLNIAIAVYRGPWPFLPSTTSGRMMRKDLTIVIMRSSVPCYLTGRGFFIVSLETYTSVRKILTVEAEIHFCCDPLKAAQRLQIVGAITINSVYITM